MKKTILRRGAAMLLALVLAIPMTAPASAADGDPNPAGPSVTLDRTELELVPDDWTATLVATAKGFPDSGGTLRYDWSSSNGWLKVTQDQTNQNEAVVTHDKDVWTPGDGEIATITVKAVWTPTDTAAAKQTAEAECRVAFRAANVPVTGVTLDRTELSLTEGGLSQLTATVAPENADNKSVNWTTSDAAVATVNQSGVVTAVKAGTATITVTTADGGKTAFCKVTVTAPVIAVADLYISPPELQFDRNAPVTRELVVSVIPAGATYEKVEWSSENPEVATVEPSGERGEYAVVTAVGPGKTVIKAEIGSVIAECEVTVSGFTLSASTLTMTDDRITLMEGKSENLVVVGPYGQAVGAGSTLWQSSDPSVVVVNSGGRITARSLGTATITATRGSYTAKCEVAVVEDTSGLIRVNKMLTAGEELGFGDKVVGYDRSIREALDVISREQTGYPLSYVTNLSAPTEQGTVYYNYLAESDTGSGVGMTERFYFAPGVGQQSIEKLSFIPKNDYSGIVEIAYTGYSTNRQSFKGVIRMQVGALYDAYYNTYSGVHVTFRASDFNAACQGLTGRDLSYVTFVLPQENLGSLYYNYPGPTPYTEKVTAGAQYRYTSSPSLNNVSFVPAAGYTGTFSITYRGVNTAGAAFTGRLVITVNDPVISAAANLYYTAEEKNQVVFRPSDFDNACRAVTGETLGYVRFTPPPAGHGSLIYNYRGTGNPGTPVTEDASYYRSGSPALGSVSFFSTSTSPEQVAIDYMGFGSGGSTFRGTVYISLQEVSQQTIRYTVESGSPVTFRADDFNTACRSATGETLNYVRFQLPAASEGVLYYQYNASRNPPYTSRVSSATSYYYSGGTRQIGNITFLADDEHAGTVSFGYTGYTSKGVSFTGTVVIQVNPASPGQVSFSGTAASPIQMYASSVRNACSGALDRELSYIQFGSLPSNSEGRLYLNYSGFDTGVQVSTGTKYYYVGDPGISQLSFVPRGGFQGTVTIPYTAVSVNGQQVNGQMRIIVNEVVGSQYFNDMGSYRWAAASVDYLYQNGVTKGMSAKTYGPSLNIRRCDFVVMLCRIFDLTATTTAADGFPDVPADAYYANEVAVAKKLGIVSGDGVNFNPKGYLTRQDAMVIIRNTLNVIGWSAEGAPVDLNSFTDSTAISGYAKSAVGTLVQYGVIKGDTNNRLRPRDIITRAEVAMILHSVMTM